MTSLNNFHIVVGELIMNCQRIEHDIKLIYAGMLRGDLDENFSKIKEKPLGPVIQKLEALDNSDGKPYLSKGDYDLLDEIREIRNHWAHKSYIQFIYKSNSEYVTAYSDEYRRLIDDNYRLSNLAGSIEKVRLDLMKKYGRI